ncbi:MAG: protein kinase [Phenylobacterium sp.]|uniref:DUF6285 domain-containing protein n=1 Tax=Phenylobacterium sp. TaxID=1871053 RepID=UPI001B51131D|nr:DUF6285 domain-containing protein [Phenylobacterium sp.]MBP7815975.1 protein kinase [Phenylobacterium sp.]MBP9755624.1 protein kinase [Phenylobacterium sp.]
MITHPRTEELVEAVARWIDTIRPELKPRDAFLARVAVNVLGVVQRELTLGPAAEIDAVERMSGLLGHGGSFEDLTAELCAKLRAGEMDASTPGLLAALRANAQDQVAIDQPNYASAR